MGYLQQILVLVVLSQQAPIPAAPAPSEAALEKARAASVVEGPRPRPVLVSMASPEFTEKARKKHFGGNVEISTLVDTNGIPQNVTVVHGVGMGLDEKAVEAVRQYRFKPALSNDGTPIPMTINISVNFRIY